MNIDKIIEKVQKLLALATSANPNEAETAAKMAQSLLDRFNLDMMSVKRDKSFSEHRVRETTGRLKFEDSMALILLNEFFHIKSFIRTQYQGRNPQTWTKMFNREMIMVGEKHNVQIAEYVFNFLSKQFAAQWKVYKKENGLKEKAKRSYMLGLKNGLRKKLLDQRTGVLEEKGLVAMPTDHDLEKFMNDQYRLKPANLVNLINSEQYRKGLEDGKNIHIAMGVSGSEKTQVGSTLRLEGQK